MKPCAPWTVTSMEEMEPPAAPAPDMLLPALPARILSVPGSTFAFGLLVKEAMEPPEPPASPDPPLPADRKISPSRKLPLLFGEMLEREPPLPPDPAAALPPSPA